ncbi:CDP-glycerol glycerophosphotransferase family protein [Paucisalibacillus globulus]|uniref:CDP-glycerol glycerophosphotransferase family protein n=1 Tax=Paucisalibacillus globulus TaxID=351095 RepID=UPI0004264709|nr:CDP-glycerol glycerophosphotransferase family protein [Paucisalibacillus globulus]
MSKLKLLPTIIVKKILIIVYRTFSKLYKIDEMKVTFASYRSDTLKDNLYFVSKDMETRFPNIKQVYLLKRFESSLFGKITYIIHLIKACFHLSTSKYFIIDDYYLPVYLITPREGIEVIQLWHGSGALKKFGLSTVGKPFGPNPAYLEYVKIHSNYSKAYVSSREVIPYYAEAFGMDELAIRPLGIPRTDYYNNSILINQAKYKFYQKYPNSIDKKILLYAPTFRGKSHYQDEFQLPFDLPTMKSCLHTEYVLLVHLHPYMKGIANFEENDFFYHIETDFTIQELLSITDTLITDYSTVFFDFSLLNRPIIFYAYDLEEYKDERDFYYDYKDLVPGPLVTDTNSLLAVIKDKDFRSDRIEEFSKRFFDYRDGKSTERVVNDIFNL